MSIFTVFFGHKLDILAHIESLIAENMQLDGTNQMVLASFYNLYIWPSYGQTMAHMPIFGHTCFGHNSAIFGPIGLKLFMGAQETIICRLINPSNDAYFSFIIFWATFCRKKCVATTCTPFGLGPLYQTKMLIVGQPSGPFGPTAISKSCFLETMFLYFELQDTRRTRVLGIFQRRFQGNTAFWTKLSC